MKLSSTPEFLIVEILCFRLPLVGELLRLTAGFELELFLLAGIISFFILLWMSDEFLTLAAPVELSLVELTCLCYVFFYLLRESAACFNDMLGFEVY